MTPAAHLSIHDVSPGTLPGVEALVDLVRGAGLPPPTLLVVAGLDWSARSLERLREMLDAGCELAGHGWTHEAPTPRSLWHRAHAAVLSRDQAEHLSRSRDDVRDRVERCHAWFGDHGFGTPDLYVPPAWALGPLRRPDLRALPFRYWETLTGFVDGDTGRAVTLPLVGFEADTRARARGLRIWNGLNLRLARLLGLTVRIGFHPDDLELLLADDARAVVERSWRAVSVREVFGG